MPVRISIDSENNTVTFQTVSVALSDTVFWMNNDPDSPHWPATATQKFSRSQIGPAPSPNSDSWPVFVKGRTPPYQTSYGCAVEGHTHEAGIINVYLDFGPAAALPAATTGADYSQPVTAGGVAPYIFAVAPPVALSGGVIYGVPPGLSLAAGDSAVILGGTPTQTGSFLFTLQASDTLQNSFQQQNYAITVGEIIVG